jgi:serine/threonine-protein kinase
MDETVTIMVSRGADAAPQALEIPARVGNVKLGDKLGEGASGVVFSGYDEALSRKVAVKFLFRRFGDLSDSAVTELVNGVRSLARVKHPNIIGVHSVDKVEGLPCIVMEYVDGASLRDMLKRSGALPPPLALSLMRQVASAVGALHDVNVIHRDLKPANILFDRDGAAHVCDFGLACEFNAADYRGRTDSVAGSPLYMAPEMFEGHVSPHSDVYALGVILFEALAGRPPFSADTMSEIQACHVAQAPPMEWLEQRKTPEDVQEVIRRALNKQRFLRFKSAGHFVRSLEQVNLPGPAEERLRLELATLVAQARAQIRDDAPRPAEGVALTTFDLLAERARRKREGRQDEGER